jgi:uncharacterized protein YqeY
MIKKISTDIISALREKDKKRLQVLRSIKTALKYREIELKKELSQDEIIAVLNTQLKRREQAIELYIQGERTDLADIEKYEIEVIKTYLPEPLTEAEMEIEVGEAIAELNAESMRDMGKVMKALKEKLGSKADGKILSSIVRAKLSN